MVLDASAMVDILLNSQRAPALVERLRGAAVHVPAHFDAEVLSALGRTTRAGHLAPRQVPPRLRRLEAAPFERHPLTTLLGGAWRRRANLRLTDALYVELAASLGDLPLVTVDERLAAATPLAVVPA